MKTQQNYLTIQRLAYLLRNSKTDDIRLILDTKRPDDSNVWDLEFRELTSISTSRRSGQNYTKVYLRDGKGTHSILVNPDQYIQRIPCTIFPETKRLCLVEMS